MSRRHRFAGFGAVLAVLWSVAQLSAVEVSLTSAEGQAGETVMVQLGLTDDEAVGLTSGGFTISYDAAKLGDVSVALSDIAKGHGMTDADNVTIGDGEIIIGFFVGVAPAENSGSWADISFTIAADAVPGEVYALALKLDGFSDKGYGPITPGGTPGSVTVVDAPPPTITNVNPNKGNVAGGIPAVITGTLFDGATVTIGGIAAPVTASSSTSLTVTVPAAGEGAADVVVTNANGKSVTLAGGFTYFTTIEPELNAIGLRDPSLDYSAIGAGSEADGSAGEVTFTVQFKDNTGSVAAGQTVSWQVTHNGGESVFVLGASREVMSNEVATIEVDTDAEGKAVITLDAEGNKQAGSTSVTVTASTTAPNSDDVSRDLSAGFSATWEVPVAAELARFTGSVTPSDEVLLQWSVASQSNNLGWEVYRSTNNVAFERIGELVFGDGTSDAFKSYSFTDSDPLQDQVVYYYLKQIDLDGTSARSEVIEVNLATAVTQQALPVANALRQNFPNPFNPETTINFELSEEAVVTLTIYDLTGQVVRTLVSGQFMTAGNYQSVWDGQNEVGVRVGSGVYLYRLNAGAFTAMKKMTLLQ